MKRIRLIIAASSSSRTTCGGQPTGRFLLPRQRELPTGTTISGPG
jgi:hypothetical protein